MFEAIDFKKSLASRKVVWSGASLLSRHFALLFVFTICTAVVLFGIFKLDLKVFALAFSSSFILLAGTIYVIRKNARLTEIITNNPPLHFKSLLENEIVNSGRRILRSNQQYLTSLKPGGLVFGSKITVLYSKTSIYLNVQNDQYSGYFPFSFGKNKSVLNKFVRMIKDADQKLSS